MGSHLRQVIGHLFSDPLAGPCDNHFLSSEHLWETPKGSEEHTQLDSNIPPAALAVGSLISVSKGYEPGSTDLKLQKSMKGHLVFCKYGLKWGFGSVVQNQVSLLPFLKKLLGQSSRHLWNHPILLNRNKIQKKSSKHMCL